MTLTNEPQDQGKKNYIKSLQGGQIDIKFYIKKSVTSQILLTSQSTV